MAAVRVFAGQLRYDLAMQEVLSKRITTILCEFGCKRQPDRPCNHNTELLASLATTSNASLGHNVESLLRLGCSLRLTSPPESHWLGTRLIFRTPFPRFTETLAIVSSRLQRKLDQNESWFAALRTAMLRSPARQTQFVLSEGSAAEPYVRRCAQLFGRQVVEVASNTEPSVEKWLHRLISQPASTNRRIELSPELVPQHDSRFLDEIPLRDRALIAFADRMIVMHARKSGHMSQILPHVITNMTSGSVLLNVDLCDASLRDEWLSAGAVGLHLFSDSASTVKLVDGPGMRCAKGSPIVSVDAINASQYFAHWTRRSPGAWPDQNEEDHLDELILGLPTKDRSALAALARIVAQERILATTGSNRVALPLVSVTAVPIDQWPTRTFRNHRSRWDFEPYGICINRNWMTRRGTSPVHYGDETLWQQIPEKERYLFQPRASQSPTGRRIDWSEEQEFRHRGDVDLAELPDDQGIIFVPSREEAQHMSRISRWPVTVVKH